MNLRERFVSSIQTVTPGYKIVRKENSRLMRFLATILFFNPGFMTNYTTTIGTTVYLPKQRATSGTQVIITLAHEAQHVWDSQHWGVAYYVGYLFPQILALGSLLSLLAIWFSIWWLLCLCLLLFLAPLPAPGRMMIERRGYLMSCAVAWWRYNNDIINEDGWPITQFTSMNYYKMWPFRKSLVRGFISELEQIKQGKYPTPVFKTVHDFLKTENLTKREKP